MKHGLNQADMFNDAELIRAVPGTDAGMQLDIFGGNHLYQSLPTGAVQEVALSKAKQKELDKYIRQVVKSARK